jgi:hypothetical protein
MLGYKSNGKDMETAQTCESGEEEKVSGYRWKKR